METNGHAEKLVKEGFAHADARKFKEAEAAFAGALGFDSKNLKALRGRARSLRELGDFGGARAALDAALGLSPADIGLLREKAMLLFEQKQAGELLPTYEKMIAADPDNGDAAKWLIWKVILLCLSGRVEEAEKFAGEVLARRKDNTRTIARGVAQYFGREYEGAVETFDEAGGEGAAFETIARLVMAEDLRGGGAASPEAPGNLPDAERLLREALEKFRESDRLRELLGLLLLNRGQYAEALEPLLSAGEAADVTKALKRLPPEADAAGIERLLARAGKRFPAGQVLLWRGVVKFNHGQQYDEAERLFGEALRADRTNPDAWGWMMASLRFLGNHGKPEKLWEALRLAQQASELFKENEDILAQCGAVFSDAGQQERAVELFDRALAKRPDFERAFVLKLTALRIQGNDGRPEKLDDADRLLRERLAQSENDPKLLTELGLLRYDQKRYGEAFDAFTRAGDWLQIAVLLPGVQLRDEPEELKTLVGKVIEAFPAELPHAAASAYYNNGLSEEALKVVDEDGLVTLVESLRLPDAGDKDAQLRAVALAEEAVRRFPANPRLKTARGVVYREAGRYEDAVEDFVDVGGDDGTGGVLQVAARLRGLRQYEEADRLLARAEESMTTNALVSRELGQLRFWRGEFDSALPAFKRALKRDPEYVDAAIGKINTLFALQRDEEAEKCIAAAVRKFHSSPHLWTMLSAIYLDRRRLKEALAAADTAMSLPADAAADVTGEGSLPLQFKISALRLMGRAAAGEKEREARLKEAERLAEEHLKKSEKDADVRIERGLLYFDQEKFEEAEECFEAARRDSAFSEYTNLRANLSYAETLIRMGRTSEVQRFFESLKQSFPDNLDVLNQCGWFHIQRGELDKAREEFDECLRLDERSIGGLNGLGGVNFERGLYAESEDYFRRARRLAPNDPGLRANLGWALLRRGETWHLSEAERECKRALEIDPTYADAYGCLGVIAFKRGELRQSEDYFRESIRRGKREGNYTDLGALYTQMGRYEEAKKHLDEAIKINDSNFQAHVELGNLYLQTDKVKEAVWEFRRAKSINPRQEEAHRSLAAAMMRAGDNAEAEQVLRSAVKTLDSNKGQLWRLHLLLSQLLVKRGEDTGEDIWYKEAQEAADAAIRHAPDREVDPYLQRGIVSHKLGENGRAADFFAKCLKRDRDHYEAARNLKLVNNMLRRERRLERQGKIGAWVLGGVSVGLLAVLWTSYLSDWAKLSKEGKVTENMLLVMSPILLGLLVVALLLPYLAKFKMPGIEAELTKPQMDETLASGPKGSISVSLPSSSGGGSRKG